MAEILNPNEIFYTTFEPKVTNRFIAYIEGIPTFLIKAMDRPKPSQEVIELPHINVTQKVKGKTKWDNITIDIYDAIVPSGMQVIMEWQRLHHEAVTGRDGYQDFYKKDISFNCLGPVGDKVELWTIKGAFITGIETGKMDFGSNEPVMISVTLAFNYAILEY